MNFPDHNHLIQLRNELWQRPRSRAAVMVGAGFSLNARPSPGIDTPFLTWRQLTRAMFDEIYPPTDRTIIDREEKFNRCNPLRLASEYEAAFERQKLEYFIRTHVPDSGHQPGPIHELLLQLPWRDVFTTNYDTLLERTEVTERAYQPVTTVEALTRRAPATYRQAARHTAITDPIHHDRGGLPDLSETFCALRQYRSTVTDRKLVRADRLFR